jgi:hypothetical protein
VKRTITDAEWAAAWRELRVQECVNDRHKYIDGLRGAMTLNPLLYPTFERFAFEAHATGRTKFSADMIYNRMRWFTEVESHSTAKEPSDYQLNNNYRSLLARLFVLLHPEFKTFFEFRERKDVPHA